MTKNKPELVAPAGDWASMRAAVESGADGIYFGIKTLNLRAYADNFDPLEIKKVMQYLHRHGKKGYLALNSIIMNEQLPLVEKVLRIAKVSDVDAVILWDMGILALARKHGIPIHLSTQASCANIEALRFYARNGVERVVLARECSLSDIEQCIRVLDKERIPCQIETFVHGAQCISISGRCFFSFFNSGKSANKGACIQPCRREFMIKDIQDGAEYVMGQDYILSPADLCTIEFIDDLVKAGISAFKIEGRMRSAEYVQATVAAYRQAIDACHRGTYTTAMKRSLLEQLTMVYNRGFSSGFYYGRPDIEPSRSLEQKNEKVFVGDVKKFYKKIGVAEIMIRNIGVKNGDTLLFTGKDTAAKKAVVDQLQQNHAFVQSAAKGMCVGIKLPFPVHPGDKVFIWRKKHINELLSS